MTKIMGIIILAIVGLMILSAGLVSAQEANTISGTVTDATTGDPIEDAVVQVDGIDPVLTDALGEYVISGVPAGEQSVTASADGYESETEDAELSENEGASVNFALQPLDEEPVVDLVVHDEGVRVAGTRRGYVGIFTTAVTGASPATFFVMTKQGDIEIQIPDGGLEPITKTPGRPARIPTDDDRVAVLVEFEDQDGSELVKVALQVIIKPTPQAPIFGAVVSITTDDNGIRTLSIMRPDGTTKEVQLGPRAKPIDLGDLVTVFPGRGPNADGAEDQDRPPVVIGLVRAAEVSQRLEGFLEDLTSGAGEPPPEVAARRAQRVIDLAARLEAHAAKHVEIMQRMSQNQNLPAQAVAGMLNGLERAQSGLDLAKTKATEARTRGGPPLQGGGQGNQNQGGANNQGQGRQN